MDPPTTEDLHTPCEIARCTVPRDPQSTNSISINDVGTVPAGSLPLSRGNGTYFATRSPHNHFCPVIPSTEIPKSMQRQAKRHGLTSPFVLAAVVCGIAASGWALSLMLLSTEQTTTVDDVTHKNTRPPSTVNKYTVSIHPGPSCPQTTLQAPSAQGPQIVTVSCNTCHSTRLADTSNRSPADLDEFHQGLSFSHNQLSCLSCHNPQDYDSLRLADGTSVPYEEVMTLCAQCHGPQTRDYKHGTHGGMTGYWDLNRGPRQRNNCVDCHHPHTPQFPKMKPTFKPRDRFLNDEENDVSDAEGVESHE